jgi:outer membrane protein TolC
MLRSILFFLFATITLVFDGSGAGAQAAPAPLDLGPAEAVSLALRNNLGIVAEEMKLEEKKLDRDSRWNLFLPKMSLSAAMSRSNKPDDDRIQPDMSAFPAYAASGFSGAFPAMTIPRWGARLAFDLSWSLSGAQFIYARQAALDYERGGISLRIAERRLTRDVTKLYDSLLLLRESIQVLEQDLDLARRRLDLARARERIGSASDLEVLSEEVNVESLVPRIQEERDSFEIALANLKSLLGMKRETEVNLTGNLDAAPGDTGGEGNALRRTPARLDLAYLRAAIGSLRNKLRIDASSLTPALFVKWTWDPTFQRDPFDSSTWSGASLGDLWKQNEGALTFGVALQLDGFMPGSATRVGMAKSKLQIAEAEISYQSALDKAELEVLSLLKELGTIAKLIGAVDKNVALAQRLYEATEKAYASGAKNYLELQDALGKLDGIRVERLRAKHDYLQKLADLEFALSAGDFAEPR